MSWCRTASGSGRWGRAISWPGAGSRNLDQGVDPMTAPMKVQSLIGGRLRESHADDVPVDPVFDPATGETIALLPYSTTEEIGEAVGAARDAFPEWSNVPVPDRAQVMFRFKAL